MRRHLFLVLLLFFLAAPPRSWADIVEVRGEGYVNGDILSDDGKEMKFKDNHGKVRTIPKADVLYAEKEDHAAKARSRFWDDVKRVPGAVKKKTDGWTAKFIGVVGAPIDRSAADAKSKMLADTLAEAGRAQTSAAGKVMTANREIYRQQNEAKEGVQSSSEEKKGRFAKL